MRKALLSFSLSLLTLWSYASNLTPGNLVVVRVGDGTSALSNASTAVFLDEYTPSGTLVQSIPLPTSLSGSNHALTLSGTASTEGAIALSPNGQYLSFAGYDTSVGYAGVASGITNRTIARVGANGVINTSTGYLAGSAYVNGNFRSAVTNDGNEFWTSGTGGNTGGVWYIPFGSFTNAATQLNTTGSSIRVVDIYNGQLYYSTNTATQGIYKEGSGLPTSFGQTASILPGLPTLDSLSSPFAFLFLDENPSVAGVDVLYVIDDNANAPKGGIYKYSLVGGTWVTNGNSPNANSLRGITGYNICSGTRLYLSGPNGIYTFFDSTGYNQNINGAYTQIVTGTANTSIKGIAFTAGTTPYTALAASVSSAANVSCNGSANGSINISVSGGSTPYHYAWTGGATTQNRTNLTPGSYTVTVTDNNGCTAAATASITQPNALLIHIDSITNLPCTGGSTGAVRISVSGGTGAYNFHWSNNATTQNISGLNAGTYRVSVTDSAGCISKDSAIVSQSGSLTVSDSVRAVTCFGQSNGAVILSVSGGTPAYTYHWNNNAASAAINNLTAGTYTVTIADQAGCVITHPVQVTQPAQLSVVVTPVNVTCYGQANGSATAVVSGGTPVYTYHWLGSVSTTPAVSNLAAAAYTVIVTDHNSCVDSTHFNITQPDSLSLTLVSTHVTTHGGSDGSINLSVTGGSGTYTYLWSNNATTQDLTNIAAGNYCVTVTDQHTCTDVNCITVTQPSGINDPEAGEKCIVYVSADAVNVRFTAPSAVNIRAELFSLTGELMYATAPAFGSDITIRIPDTGFAPACYIVKVTSDTGIFCKKVLLMK